MNDIDSRSGVDLNFFSFLILTLQNPVLFDLMHSIHFFVAQNFDYLAINHHYLLSPSDYYLSDAGVNVFVHLSQNSNVKTESNRIESKQFL